MKSLGKRKLSLHESQEESNLNLEIAKKQRQEGLGENHATWQSATNLPNIVTHLPILANNTKFSSQNPAGKPMCVKIIKNVPLKIVNSQSNLISYPYQNINPLVLNTFTNINPIHQEKIYDIKPKLEPNNAKKEYIIKPLSSLQKQLFSQNTYSSRLPTVDTRADADKHIVSPHRVSPTSITNGIVMNPAQNSQPATSGARSGVNVIQIPSKRIIPRKIKLIEGETLRPVNFNTVTKAQLSSGSIDPRLLVNPIIIKPLNSTATSTGVKYRTTESIPRSNKNTNLDMENVMIKHEDPLYLPIDAKQHDQTSTSPRADNYQPDLSADIKSIHSLGDDDYTLFGFSLESPVCDLKEIFVKAGILSETDTISYFLKEDEMNEAETLRRCCIHTTFDNVDLSLKILTADPTDVKILINDITMTSSVASVSEDASSEENMKGGQKKKRITNIRKKKDRTLFGEKGGRIQLWQFLLTTLLRKQHMDKIEWMTDDGEFKFVDHMKFAKVWGEFKDKPGMTYTNMSRAIRYYYDDGIMQKVKGRQYQYKFSFDIKATTGYTISEMRCLYDCSADDNYGNSDKAKIKALKELLSTPLMAQKFGPKRSNGQNRLHRGDSDEVQDLPDVSEIELEDRMGMEQSFYNNCFDEDQLASIQITQQESEYCFSDSNQFIDYGLEDSNQAYSSSCHK